MEIENNMKMLSGDTIKLNNDSVNRDQTIHHSVRSTKSTSKENNVLGDYSKIGKKVVFN